MIIPPGWNGRRQEAFMGQELRGKPSESYCLGSPLVSTTNGVTLGSDLTSLNVSLFICKKGDIITFHNNHVKLIHVKPEQFQTRSE